jgi:hypothetical protein
MLVLAASIVVQKLPFEASKHACSIVSIETMIWSYEEIEIRNMVRNEVNMNNSEMELILSACKS